jgi:hypothetical protein
VRHCGVVVTQGSAPAAAVAAAAPRFPSVRFAVVGGTARRANVTMIGGSPSAVRSAVAGLVTAAVATSG